VSPLGIGEILEPHALHAARREAGEHLVVQDAVLLGHELVARRSMAASCSAGAIPSAP